MLCLLPETPPFYVFSLWFFQLQFTSSSSIMKQRVARTLSRSFISNCDVTLTDDRALLRRQDQFISVARGMLWSFNPLCVSNEISVESWRSGYSDPGLVPPGLFLQACCLSVIQPGCSDTPTSSPWTSVSTCSTAGESTLSSTSLPEIRISSFKGVRHWWWQTVAQWLTLQSSRPLGRKRMEPGSSWSWIPVLITVSENN